MKKKLVLEKLNNLLSAFDPLPIVCTHIDAVLFQLHPTPCASRRFTKGMRMPRPANSDNKFFRHCSASAHIVWVLFCFFFSLHRRLAQFSCAIARRMFNISLVRLTFAAKRITNLNLYVLCKENTSHARAHIPQWSTERFDVHFHRKRLNRIASHHVIWCLHQNATNFYWILAEFARSPLRFPIGMTTITMIQMHIFAYRSRDQQMPSFSSCSPPIILRVA